MYFDYYVYAWTIVIVIVIRVRSTIRYIYFVLIVLGVKSKEIDSAKYDLRNKVQSEFVVKKLQRFFRIVTIGMRG